MRRSLSLVTALIKIRITRRLADPAGFWAAFFVDSSVFLLQAAVFWLVYMNVDDINGWGRWQSVLFVGTFTMIDALYMALYFFGVIGIPKAICSGRLELYLAKPVDPLVYLSFEGADPGSALLVLPALALVGTAASNLGVRFDPQTILAYAAAVVLMLVLMYDLMVLMRSASFILGRSGNVQEVEGALVEFGFRVPGVAWRGAWKILFRVVLPYGLIATFPTEAFLGQADAATWAAALAVTAAFTFLARLAWKAGIRRYAGVGS